MKKYNFVVTLIFTLLPFWTSRSHSGINIAFPPSPDFTNVTCIIIFNNAPFQGSLSAEMLACAAIFACF